MTTPTLNSAYPPAVAELMPRARALATAEQAIPSVRRLMSEYGIGDEKARQIRAALRDDPELAELPDGSRIYNPKPRTDPQPAAPRPRTKPRPRPQPDPQPERANNPQPAEPEPPARTQPTPSAEPQPEPVSSRTPARPEPVASHTPADPVSRQPIPLPATPRKPVRTWWLIPLSLGAFVAIWSGWVGLGEMTGFGVVHPLPGIADGFAINSAITLPVGVETYAAFALRVWISGQVPDPARKFARVSAIGSLVLGAFGQIAYHVLAAAGVTSAPWWITTIVACFPVAVLGMGAALAHLMRTDESH